MIVSSLFTFEVDHIQLLIKPLVKAAQTGELQEPEHFGEVVSQPVVMGSAAGWYIGTFSYGDPHWCFEPYQRLTDYFPDEASAVEQYLDGGWFLHSRDGFAVSFFREYIWRVLENCETDSDRMLSTLTNEAERHMHSYHHGVEWIQQLRRAYRWVQTNV